MNNFIKTTGITLAIALLGITTNSMAHEDDPDVEIHRFENGETWKNCSFMIHHSLTQYELRRFIREAGDIISFRSLAGASSLGKGKFEAGITMSKTPIDQTAGAWNNTFAHPLDENNNGTAHWLGSQVNLPAVQIRYGINDQTDMGFYITRDFAANYGFTGLELKRSFILNESKNIVASGRLSHVRLFGPEDLTMNQTMLEGLVSKKISFAEPYAGVSLGVNKGKETTDKVQLNPVTAFSPKLTTGIAVKAGFLTGALEYNISTVRTTSFKIAARF